MPILLSPLASDAMEILAHGGVSLTDNNGNDGAGGPGELLHGGDHHDDTSKVYRQNFVRNGSFVSSFLPRDKIVSLIERNDYARPTPKSWGTNVESTE